MPSPIPPQAASLLAPTVTLQASFLEAVAECHAEARHLELDIAVLSQPREFELYVDTLRRDAEGPSRFPGWVPQTVMWWAAEDVFLGRINVRHRLSELTQRRGGHIGYEVRPSARRQGHATAMLAAALPIAHALGVDPAWIDCDLANVASRRVIEHNGGRLLRHDNEAFYYRLPTGCERGATNAQRSGRGHDVEGGPAGGPDGVDGS